MTIEMNDGIELFHPSYDITQKDSLGDLPDRPAVFAIFAIVNDKPCNCRFVGITTNLRHAVRELYEDPPNEGMRSFMRGAWCKVLRYEFVGEPGDSGHLYTAWQKKYEPGLDNDGEYPGYYN